MGRPKRKRTILLPRQRRNNQHRLRNQPRHNLPQRQPVNPHRHNPRRLVTGARFAPASRWTIKSRPLQSLSTSMRRNRQR